MNETHVVMSLRLTTTALTVVLFITRCPAPLDR